VGVCAKGRKKDDSLKLLRIKAAAAVSANCRNPRRVTKDFAFNKNVTRPDRSKKEQGQNEGIKGNKSPVVVWGASKPGSASITKAISSH